MPLFLYIDRPTFLHRLHPIVKVLGMLCFFVAAFVSQRPAVMLPIAAGVAVLITRGRRVAQRAPAAACCSSWCSS